MKNTDSFSLFSENDNKTKRSEKTLFKLSSNNLLSNNLNVFKGKLQLKQNNDPFNLTINNKDVSKFKLDEILQNDKMVKTTNTFGSKHVKESQGSTALNTKHQFFGNNKQNKSNNFRGSNLMKLTKNNFNVNAKKDITSIDQYPELKYNEMETAISYIDDIISIRKQLRDDYAKITPKFLSKARNNIVMKWKEVINKLITVDIRLTLHAVKVLGDIFIEFDDYERAKSFYSYFKFLATNLELIDELMQSYECLGIISKFLYRYEKAIIYFKKQIEVAWILENRDSELRAYDHIGMQYFYLGNHQRAKYYHLRFLCGRYEKDTELKRRMIQSFQDRNFNFFNISEKGEYRLKIIDNSSLRLKLKSLLDMFESNKLLSLDEIDMSRVPESVNSSIVSKTNITFNIISK